MLLRLNGAGQTVGEGEPDETSQGARATNTAVFSRTFTQDVPVSGARTEPPSFLPPPPLHWLQGTQVAAAAIKEPRLLRSNFSKLWYLYHHSLLLRSLSPVAPPGLLVQKTLFTPLLIVLLSREPTVETLQGCF